MNEEGGGGTKRPRREEVCLELEMGEGICEGYCALRSAGTVYTRLDARGWTDGCMDGWRVGVALF